MSERACVCVCVHVCEREAKQARGKFDILAAVVSKKLRSQQSLEYLLQLLQCSFLKLFSGMHFQICLISGERRAEGSRSVGQDMTK